jgi:hypothetical protein
MFTNKIKSVRISKHQASKKNFKHKKNLSRGELRDQQKLNK